jgi:PAS domain S-box-containing protein
MTAASDPFDDVLRPPPCAITGTGDFDANLVADAVVDFGGDQAGLLLSIRNSPIASVVSNPRMPDNPIVAANMAFYALTGYGADEVLGRNCRFLAGPATEPWLTERIQRGVREKRPVLVEILNYKRSGAIFRNAVLVAPIFDAAGELEFFIGSQVELPLEEEGLPSARRQRAIGLVRSLSPRQRQILEQIAAGQRSKQIAQNLRISEKTVKMHRALLLTKLGKGNVADAVRVAVEAGL